MCLVWVADPTKTYRKFEKDLLVNTFDKDVTVEEVDACDIISCLDDKGDRPDIIILDTLQHGVNGVDLINKVKKEYSDIQLMVISSEKDKVDSIKYNLPILTKPFLTSSFIKVFTTLYTAQNIL